MARDVGVNFVTTAVEKGTKAVFSGTTALIETQAKTIKRLGWVTERSLGAARFTLDLWNRALEISGRLLDIWRRTLGKALDTSLKFRRANDGTRETIDEFKRSTELLWARLGDALLPTILALTDTLDPLIQQFIRWQEENQGVIATKIAEWALNLGDFLTNFVIPAVGLTAKAFLGIKILLQTVGLGIAAFTTVALEGFERMLRATSAITQFIPGMGQVSKASADAAETVERLGSASFSAMTGLADGINENLERFDRLDAFVKELRERFGDAVGDFAINVMKRLKTATLGTNKSLEEQNKELKELEERWKKIMDIMAKVRNLAKQRSDEHKAFLHDQASAWSEVTGAAQQYFLAITQGEADFKAGIKGVIMALANKAAAAIFASVLENPALFFPANLILATTASTGVLATVGAFANSFQEGGIARDRRGFGRVFGGTPGRDSVLALLQQDELVLPVPFVKQLRRLLEMPGQSAAVPAFAGGGRVSAPMLSRATELHVHNHFSSVIPATAGDNRRFAEKRIMPPLRELLANGMGRG